MLQEMPPEFCDAFVRLSAGCSISKAVLRLLEFCLKAPGNTAGVLGGVSGADLQIPSSL